MDKLKMHSPDITQDNIARIRELFPECITEARGDDGSIRLAVDFDQLKQALSDSVVEGPQERYRLDWPGKREALLAANAPIAMTLRPCREESVNFDTTRNIYIEGDNLEALKLLQESYLGKVKMIYIDPPYNTGNDFIYDDDFSEDAAAYMERSQQADASGARMVANTESNGKFHSSWLSMMYARLKLAKNLLSDTGTIFISIDDGEVGNLRKLSDQVFGENNFIANIIWQKKYTRSNDAKWLSDNHDHILCYAKNKNTTLFNLLPRNEEQLAAYANPDNHKKGRWKATPLHAKSGTNTSSYTFKNGVKWTPPTGTFRRFTDETMKQMDDGNEIWFGSDGKQTPSRKSFLCEVKSGVTAVTIWPYNEVGHSHEANNELKTLGIGGCFDNPKPTKLIKRILQLTTEKDDLIMDFFSGSGTTAHATMALNQEDGGNRKYICIQFPEKISQNSVAQKTYGFKTITEIGAERIRLAGKEITEGSAVTDIGFRVLRIDSSNMSDVYYTPELTPHAKDTLFTDNIKRDRSSEDLLFQVMLDWGVDLSLPIATETIQGKEVFFVDGNALVACFDAAGGVDEALVKALASREPLRVVFRDAGFRDSAAKINVEQVFKLLSPATDVRCI